MCSSFLHWIHNFQTRSKENVTRFAWKYDIPIPKTYIFYDKSKAEKFIDKTKFPKIVKKSYGPSKLWWVLCS